MNFVVSSSTLLKHLQTVHGVIGVNNSMPIVENFLLEIDNKKLCIIGTDLKTTIKTFLEIESNGKISVCLRSDMILDILKNLPDQPLTFSVNGDNYEIEIAYSNGKSKMIGYDGSDFPLFKELEDFDSASIKSEALLKAINKTIFATSTDELRQVMCGVYCQITSEDITFAATDAHKLVRYRRTDSFSPTQSGTSSFILPKKALSLLKNNLENDDNEVIIKFDNNRADFNFGNIELTCSLIDGKYPNYEAVIPQENPNVLTIDRETLLNSIKRVSIFANRTTRQVVLEISGSELTISSEDIDYSMEAKERLTCNYVGEDIVIGFSARYLIEMLSNISGNEVILKMSQPNRAGIITPAEKEEENSDLLMLVMPVMVN